jgi:tetratricopeptide (TPR) repeat protein
MWDVSTGQEVLFLQTSATEGADPGFNPQVAWSHGGRYLAASNLNRSINVWDSDAWESPQSRARSLAEAETRAFAWHLKLAWRAQQADAPTAFAFHWSPIAGAEPPDVADRFWRARLFAYQGQWRTAATECEQVLAAEPSEFLMYWIYTTGCQALAGDGDGCRKTCLKFWERFQTQMQGDQANLQVLGFLAAADRTRSLAAALGSLARLLNEKPGAGPIHLYLLALTQYRGGHFEEALRSCERSLAAKPGGQPLPGTYPLLALIHHQLGYRDAARQALDRADAWLLQQTGSKTDPSRLFRSYPADALPFLLLHDEAHQRLGP